jgi:hypothetical protein
MRIALPLTLVLMTLAAPAVAQVHAWPGHDSPADRAERHRAADAEQRARSQEQAAFARQQATEARLTRMELQAARQALPRPTSSPLDAAPTLPSAPQNDATRRSVTEIDAWLDRGPR